MADKFTVIDSRRVPSADENRRGKFDWLVTYQLDPMRTYIVPIPEDTLSEDVIRDYVRKDLEESQRFTGREFPL